MTPELSRPLALDRIGAAGAAMAIRAEPAERAALAVRLQIPAVASLACSFRLRRIGESVIEAVGELDAVVTQVCVVSLEDFAQAVHEAFTLHFVPAGSEEDEPDPESIDQVPFSGNALDLGEAAVEQLALALDPYPRMPGADLPPDWAGPAANPFAALSGLRSKP